MPRTLSFEIAALAPISHGDFADGRDTGNAMLFRRMPIVGTDGQIYEIPVISGNAIRGVMRRRLTCEFMDRLGFHDDRLYIALANGGALNKNVDAYIRPEKIRQIREIFPILSAFGSALYSFMLPGAFNMSFAILNCAELGTGCFSAGDLVADISQTRHIERTKADYGEIKPMPYTMEAVVSGAVFNASVTYLNHASDMDRAVVAAGLNGIVALGGKAASGFGRVAISETFDDALYRDWLEAMTDDYRERARALAQEWR